MIDKQQVRAEMLEAEKYQARRLRYFKPEKPAPALKPAIPPEMKVLPPPTVKPTPAAPKPTKLRRPVRVDRFGVVIPE